MPHAQVPTPFWVDDGFLGVLTVGFVYE